LNYKLLLAKGKLLTIPFLAFSKLVAFLAKAAKKKWSKGSRRQANSKTKLPYMLTHDERGKHGVARGKERRHRWKASKANTIT
ncbi:hypothetical protein AMTR_s00042p00231080, partial [Amborella trichopoda]